MNTFNFWIRRIESALFWRNNIFLFNFDGSKVTQSTFKFSKSVKYWSLVNKEDRQSIKITPTISKKTVSITSQLLLVILQFEVELYLVSIISQLNLYFESTFFEFTFQYKPSFAQESIPYSHRTRLNTS